MIDAINSVFVAAAVCFAAGDVVRAYYDRCVRGMSIFTAVLFTIWPIWDMYYYHTLGQTLSLAVCTVLACLRAAWLWLLCGHDVRRSFSLR